MECRTEGLPGKSSVAVADPASRFRLHQKGPKQMDRPDLSCPGLRVVASTNAVSRQSSVPRKDMSCTMDASVSTERPGESRERWVSRQIRGAFDGGTRNHGYSRTTDGPAEPITVEEVIG